MLYNAFWTSWPCIFTFVFERDLGTEISLSNPVLYMAGAKKYYFNYGVFWRWMAFALYHGALTFFVTMMSL